MVYLRADGAYVKAVLEKDKGVSGGQVPEFSITNSWRDTITSKLSKGCFWSTQAHNRKSLDQRSGLLFHIYRACGEGDFDAIFIKGVVD